MQKMIVIALCNYLENLCCFSLHRQLNFYELNAGLRFSYENKMRCLLKQKKMKGVSHERPLYHDHDCEIERKK